MPNQVLNLTTGHSMNVQWKILNYTKIVSKNRYFIESPIFEVGGPSTTSWKLEVYPDGDLKESRGFTSLYILYVDNDSKKSDPKDKFVPVKEKSALIDEETALIEEKSVLIAEQSALIEEKLALNDKKAATSEEKSALIEEQSALNDKKSALINEKLALIEKKSANIKEQLEIVEEKMDLPKVSVQPNFYIINAKGKVKYLQPAAIHDFEKEDAGWGFRHFLPNTKLMKKKNSRDGHVIFGCQMNFIECYSNNYDAADLGNQKVEKLTEAPLVLSSSADEMKKPKFEDVKKK